MSKKLTLYYSAGACSTSCHITLEEAGLDYDAVEIDYDQSNHPNTLLVQKLNPLGTLPVLITSDGKQLDQNLAIHVYAADLASDKKLLPPIGSIERAQALNWLSFVCSDLHKSIGGMFSLKSNYPDAQQQAAVRKVMIADANDYLRYVDEKLTGKTYLMGDQFTPADAYAFIVIGWTKWVDLPLTSFKNIEAYLARVAARPAVQRVLRAEGLLEDK